MDLMSAFPSKINHLATKVITNTRDLMYSDIEKT